MTSSTPRRPGPSVHIGVNNVDQGSYSFRVPPLQGCLNDANSMYGIAIRHGYSPTLLIDGTATAANVQGVLNDGVRRLSADQTMLVTYAGHGSQVDDISGDEQHDKYDETWVLYDRQLIDDELAAIWQQAPAGARILIVSDSCHSGTVARAGFGPTAPPPDYRAPGSSAFGFRYGELRQRVAEPTLRGIRSLDPQEQAPVATLQRNLPQLSSDDLTEWWRRTREQAVTAGAEAVEDTWAQSAGVDVTRKPRAVDPVLANRDLMERQDLYRPILSWASGQGPISASVLLVSAARDNQTALDGRQNGLFTQELLNVLGAGGYQGYQSFVSLIDQRINLPDHRPGLYWAYGPDQAFEQADPFVP